MQNVSAQSQLFQCNIYIYIERDHDFSKPCLVTNATNKWLHVRHIFIYLNCMFCAQTLLHILLCNSLKLVKVQKMSSYQPFPNCTLFKRYWITNKLGFCQNIPCLKRFTVHVPKIVLYIHIKQKNIFQTFSTLYTEAQ